MQIPRRTGTFHIIGIGGIGMSAIAEILLAKGYAVQGSDQKESANTRRLRDKGVRIAIGHDAANLAGAANIVISSAVKPGNPELDAARDRGLTIISRAEMLAELMRLYKTVSVTGTHGKTTTTSLIAHIFTAAGQDPTVITGGILNTWGTNARLGQSPWMIVEADESDGTFVRLPTEIGVVTNIDPEHLDHFGTIENMQREFAAFLRQVPFYGLIAACSSHPQLRDLLEQLDLRRDGRPLLTYGTHAGCDLLLEEARHDRAGACFSVRLSERVAGGAGRLENWRLPLAGEHNLLNALAAIAVAAHAEIPRGAIREALATFPGVKRRFQLTGTWNGVSVYDDYGHHPTEIAAVLKAARAGAEGRLIAVVEPHRYSRVRDLFTEFSRSFRDASVVLVAPLYAAGEAPIAGICHESLAEAIRKAGHPSVLVLDSPEALAPTIRNLAVPGDQVICFGAGNSTDWAQSLPALLASGGTAAAKKQSAGGER